MTEKEKIRAKIERLLNAEEEWMNKQGFTDVHIGMRTGYKNVLSFIDSMQEKCNITGIKSKEATGKLKECIDNITDESLAKARKQLQEESKECMYSKDNYTDEDRKALCDGCEEERCKYSKLNTMLDVALSKETKESWNKWLKEETKEPVSEELDFIATRNALAYVNNINRGESPWLDSDMELAYEDGMKAGANWQKQQMMAKAVDIEVKVDAGGYPYIPQMELYDYGKDIPLAKEGDKYKVVLIKES